MPAPLCGSLGSSFPSPGCYRVGLSCTKSKLFGAAGGKRRHGQADSGKGIWAGPSSVQGPRRRLGLLLLPGARSLEVMQLRGPRTHVAAPVQGSGPNRAGGLWADHPQPPSEEWVQGVSSDTSSPKISQATVTSADYYRMFSRTTHPGISCTPCFERQIEVGGRKDLPS